MRDVMFPEPLDPMDRAMQRMDKKAWAEADAEIVTLKARLAEAERHLNDYWCGATTAPAYALAMRRLFPVNDGSTADSARGRSESHD